MGPAPDTDRDRIALAILALGGQGGGVLADWIVEIANHNGYVAQGTSVPGVAQRTGSTVYYIEMVRAIGAGENQPHPVLATMPVPGDVDIVVASELMEAGRAILRGFVTADRTTLIGSTHRIYAISEKSALADGTGSSARILDAAERRAARFIGFDMEEAANRAGSVISSVMLGALAASEALPFAREAFEDAIRRSGKAVNANLKGFGAGVQGALARRAEAEAPSAPPEPTTPAGWALKTRILTNLPEAAWPLATAGVARLMDYQDRAYAELYLDRLDRVTRHGDPGLVAAVARHLALWMAYEDTIRVADLKIRASRRQRVETEVRLANGQLLEVTEYMHPRLREICDTLPARLGRAILARDKVRLMLERCFAKGRHVRTTSLRWHFMLRAVAAMRAIRRSTLRYAEENDRIEVWLDLIEQSAATDTILAREIAETQCLIKGYGETFERGLEQFAAIMASARTLVGHGEAANRVNRLRRAALADDNGAALHEALA